MINPLKYVPAVRDYPRLTRYSKESKWGFTIYTSKHEKIPHVKYFLIHKDTYSRIVRFTKPIDMKKYIELRKDIEAEILSKLNPNDIIKKNLTVNISDEYEAEYEKVKKEWKQRLDANDGHMLMQYNAKQGIFGDSWVRMCQPCPYEVTGEAPEHNLKKISYLRYLFLEIPIDIVVRLYCKLNNLRYWKEIKVEKIKQEKADKADKEWWDKHIEYIDEDNKKSN